MFISGNKIQFGYSSQEIILEDLSFCVEKGNTLAIVGGSGCGKSTLLRILAGILPNSDSCELRGTILIDDTTPDQYRKSGKLSFMFQEATLLPHLTVRKNIELPLKIKQIGSVEKVESLLKVVGLENYSDYLPNQLSGGMKTRVALARSFVTMPKFLLLDEPFSALDIAWRSKLYRELNNLKTKAETTVIIVTHDVQEALLLADQIIVLNQNGCIQSTKTIETKYTPDGKLNDIAGYMSSIYDNYMLPIQDDIINGQNVLYEK